MPRFIPSAEIVRSTVTNGEKKVFLAFAKQLGPDFTVFHSLEWVSTVGDFKAQGEIDFLVFHPTRGVLVCEVKGGHVFHRDEDGKWLSGDRSDALHPIKDPAKQARGSALTIFDKLRAHPQFKGRFPAPIGHCVIFPDVHFDCETPNLPRELIIDDVGCSRMAPSIDRVFDFWVRKYPFLPGLGPGQDRVVMEVLNPVFHVVRTLSQQIGDERVVLLRLTDEQRRLLDFLGDRRRAFISGRAGSGKTVLAVEKARREALAGRRTLFLCFNVPLSMHAARELEGTGAEAHTFHHFIRITAEAAGLEWPSPRKTDPEFFEYGAIELLREAREQVDIRYDALVVDEGQDFKDHWWLEVESLAGSDGSLTVFYDRHQAMYGDFPVYLNGGWEETHGQKRDGLRGGDVPFRDELFRLDRNCRSTAAIERFAGEILGIDPGPGLPGVEEEPVEHPVVERFGSSRELERRLESILRELIDTEGLSEDQIIILGTHRKEKSSLAEVDRLGRFPIVKLKDAEAGREGREPAAPDTAENEPAAGEPGTISSRTHILYSTLHRFKGLESDVVILVDVDFDRIDPNLYYVGATRARHRLFVLGWDRG